MRTCYVADVRSGDNAQSDSLRGQCPAPITPASGGAGVHMAAAPIVEPVHEAPAVANGGRFVDERARGHAGVTRR